ncbi:MAG: aminoacetone oxidase family FAD-binding enzyme [Clostridia bacterium]|nr:aminoacetone oxidase family FAD-binding enzyme [Clostridia bacterium]
MKQYDVMIIGGGAAGLAAALSASEQKKDILVLESAPRVGRKLLATGNGRCNLINMLDAPYYGDAGFAKQVLDACNRADVLAFFHGLGLVTREEGGGRVYPGSGQAASVLDVMRKALDRRGVAILCDGKVQRITRQKNGFRVTAGENSYDGKKVIVACGGMAGGKLGHDGGAYALLTAFGHTLKQPLPALTPLLADKKVIKGLSGLRLPAILTLCDGEKPVSRAAGEVLFTDYGVSGICAMQLSADVHRAKKPILYADFSPMMGLVPCLYERLPVGDVYENLDKVQRLLKDRSSLLPREEVLCGLLPRLLSEKMQGLTGQQLAKMLCAFAIPITGLRGFEYAQVTRGGVNTRDFDAHTMESALQKGLYAAGEILNVDGDCGGYNLLFAFASGILAGKAAAQ